MRKFRRYDAPFDLAEATRIGKAAVFNPSAALVPVDADRDSEPAMRRRLAVAVRDEVERRKRRLKVLTYDDLLTRLAAALGDPSRGDAAKARLRERYHVALVDEFQDTDPIQWEIVRTAFGDGDTTLVLIGDPKQAIYNFRGADVYAYLDCRPHGHDAGHAGHQLAQRPGADRRLRRADGRGPARPPRHRVPHRPRRRRTISSHGCAAPRTPPRCACGCSTATTGSCG